MSLKLVRRQEQIEFITTEGEEKKFNQRSLKNGLQLSVKL
jgi:hypothetical protein